MMRYVLVTMILYGLLCTQHVLAECLLEKDKAGNYHLCSPFQNHDDWEEVKGSPVHHGADEYAQDWNKGIENNDLGITVYPVFKGTVVFAGDLEYTPKDATEPSKEVFIRHNTKKELVVRYSHLCGIKVEKGNTVSADTLLGYVGKSGLVPPNDFAHLHLVLFEGIKGSDESSFKFGGTGGDRFSGEKMRTVRREFGKLNQQTDLTLARKVVEGIVDSILEVIYAIKEGDTDKLKVFEDDLNNRENEL